MFCASENSIRIWNSTLQPFWKQILTELPILSLETRSSSTRLWTTSLTDWLMTPFLGPSFSSSLSWSTFGNTWGLKEKTDKINQKGKSWNMNSSFWSGTDFMQVMDTLRCWSWKRMIFWHFNLKRWKEYCRNKFGKYGYIQILKASSNPVYDVKRKQKAINSNNYNYLIKNAPINNINKHKYILTKVQSTMTGKNKLAEYIN